MKVERDNVEFLRAWEDGTWDVESYNCPEDPSAPDFEAKALKWCHETLMPMTQYRKVVYWAVYSYSSDGLDHGD